MRYLSGLDREGFFKDEKTMDAVVRNLEIIGEAANRLPKDFLSSHPEVEWRRITGLRHRIVHGYFGVDYEIIWQITQKELSKLKKEVTLLCDAIEQSGE